PECIADTVEPTAEACGRNLRGRVQRVCTARRFEATCVDPDECTDGTERNTGVSCEIDGVPLETCFAGAWGQSACLHTGRCQLGTERLGAQCDTGGRSVEACGPQGTWWETGRCQDPCRDGDQRVLSTSCGFNG